VTEAMASTQGGTRRNVRSQHWWHCNKVKEMVTAAMASSSGKKLQWSGSGVTSSLITQPFSAASCNSRQGT